MTNSSAPAESRVGSQASCAWAWILVLRGCMFLLAPGATSQPCSVSRKAGRSTYKRHGADAVNGAAHARRYAACGGVTGRSMELTSSRCSDVAVLVPASRWLADSARGAAHLAPRSLAVCEVSASPKEPGCRCAYQDQGPRPVKESSRTSVRVRTPAARVCYGQQAPQRREGAWHAGEPAQGLWRQEPGRGAGALRS